MFFAVIVLIGGYQIGLVVLAFLVISLLIGVMFKGKIEALTKESTMASHKKLGLLVESVESAQKIKASGAKWNLMSKWNTLSENAVDDEIRIKHYTDISSFLATFSQQISYVAIVATGAYIIATTTDITMGALIAITILSNKVFAPIAQLPSLFVQWGRAKVALEDLDNIYKLAQDNDGVERPITHKLHSYDIRCDDVEFGYYENSRVVNIPKLTIKEGEKVAILGVIGSGKSTLLKLLSGLYKPTNGKVFLDNLESLFSLMPKDVKVVIIGNVPAAYVAGQGMRKGFINCLAVNEAVNAESECPLTYEKSLRESLWINKLLFKLAKKLDNVNYFDPGTVLCNSDECYVVNNGRLIYSDHAHLTSYGADLVVGHLKDYLLSVDGI
jgi:ABC-type transport system involved in cytochrome bd biosynthesis fused ATPase/permease subunit